MEKPDFPLSETSRLKTLHALGILDTETEERFDRLTRLAKRMFDVPIAMVSLVDENRQWYKSCIGVDFNETPRDISFCGHAILGDQIFVIPDTTKDPRFLDNPQVLTEPFVRFYAGYPIKAANGEKLGTLCIIDQIPRFFDDEDLEALKDLAVMVEREIEAVQLATLDELTGISNRRGFISLAQNRINLCKRQRKPATLVFFDLNKLKQITDKFGHIAGDKILIQFSEVMARHFRNSDVYGRIGGDEFVILLTSTSEKKATATIERFKNAIEDHNRDTQCDYEISFSCRRVLIEQNNDQPIESFLHLADAVMYEDKYS